jgi:hypothetical protein
MEVAAGVRDGEQAVDVIELEILPHRADGLRRIVAGADGSGQRGQDFIDGDFVAIEGAVLEALERQGMQEVREQGSLVRKTMSWSFGSSVSSP